MHNKVAIKKSDSVDTIVVTRSDFYTTKNRPKGDFLFLIIKLKLPFVASAESSVSVKSASACSWGSWLHWPGFINCDISAI